MIGRDRSQGGSVSIVVAGVATVALVASLGVADVGKALVARARARAAADAAALAAAQELALPGGRTPVELADDYATRNGATLVSCECVRHPRRGGRGRGRDRSDVPGRRPSHGARQRPCGHRRPAPDLRPFWILRPVTLARVADRRASLVEPASTANRGRDAPANGPPSARSRSHGRPPRRPSPPPP